MVKKLDHVGIVVKSLDESLPTYESILGVKPVSVRAVPTQGVRAAFLFAPGQPRDTIRPRTSQLERKRMRHK